MEKFYICKECGNIVGMVEAKCPSISCCGQKMQPLVANTVEASREKHLPVVEIEGNLVKVSVGSVFHPMVEAHNIGWVYLQTDKGGHRKSLGANVDPVVTFALADEKPVAVYAYCNLHGLWKTEL